jgi:hypothetical protein
MLNAAEEARDELVKEGVVSFEKTAQGFGGKLADLERELDAGKLESFPKGTTKEKFAADALDVMAKSIRQVIDNGGDAENMLYRGEYRVEGGDKLNEVLNQIRAKQMKLGEIALALDTKDTMTRLDDDKAALAQALREKLNVQVTNAGIVVEKE